MLLGVCWNESCFWACVGMSLASGRVLEQVMLLGVVVTFPIRNFVTYR
jgi:hypothetical protein